MTNTTKRILISGLVAAAVAMTPAAALAVNTKGHASLRIQVSGPANTVYGFDGGVGKFRLDTGASGISGDRFRLASDVDVIVHQVGAAPLDIVCNGTATVTLNVAAGTATINMPDHSRISCVFSN